MVSMHLHHPLLSFWLCQTCLLLQWNYSQDLHDLYEAFFFFFSFLWELAHCSHLLELPLLQANQCITRIQAKTPVQRPLIPEMVLKVCVLMESLHGKRY